MTDPTVSVIICTRDRAADLARTLDALHAVRVPDEVPCELLVVDNGSTDDTAQIVRGCRLPQMPVRSVSEGRSGKGFAYNTGLAAARGGIVLFTDDDVRPPRDWIVGMAGPILSGGADAVAGGVAIAPHLDRPWMTPLHRARLASTEALDPAAPPAMVGANMAFSRSILGRIPGFDTELGPGALGFGDETLLSLQIRAADFRLVSAFDVIVEHHFDPARLLRESWLMRAAGGGRSDAYLDRHWEHRRVPAVAALVMRRRLLLAWRRLTRRAEMGSEGIAEWEYLSVRDLAYLRQMQHEWRRPACYDRHGLVKRVP